MRKFISIALVGVVSFGISYGAVHKVAKDQKKIYRIERAPSDHSVLGQGSSKIVMPNTRNGGVFTLVDSSSNGFGMVASETRPLFVDPENTGYWFSSYRQYCGENTTHGQLGGAFSDNGEDWTTYANLNSNGNPPWGGGGVGGSGVGQARYPSAVGTEDIPIAMWNEYTGDTSTGSLYGGRPYYSFDEFGWDGGSFAYPVDTDPLWNTDSKDLWVGSVSISYDDDLDMPVINAAYNDWTRGNRWLFHSEYVDDATIIMGEEQLVIDEVNDLVGGDDAGSFNTSPMVSCTPEGICGVGVVGLFDGADTDASDVSNYHTGIFKMSDDHGASWYGGTSGDASLGHANSADGDGYYFIPNQVWDDLIATQFTEPFVDECEGTTDEINDVWTYYNDDFKVDRNGNPHWVIQTLGCGAEFCYYSPEAGFYHFTIDRDYLDNPGPINTETGWNWSFVMSGELTWGWADMTGESYIWNTHGSLAFSIDDPDVVYVVTNMATEGAFAGDEANLEDPCYYTTWEDYPEWSEDIYIVKSTDGGSTWWNPLNVTNTPDISGNVCPNGYPKCDQAEQYPHAAQWATDDEVYFMYQMPNWNWNESDEYSGVGYMNYIYVGKASFTEDNQPSYPWENCNDPQYIDGDLNQDQMSDILDIVMYVNVIVFSDYSLIDGPCQIEQADINDDESIDIFDIIEVINIIFN